MNPIWIKKIVIDKSQYHPEGGTPLFDAIGQILGWLKDNSTIVIATDGEDTTSRNFSKAKITEMIKDAKEWKKIKFIFAAKGMDAFTGGTDIALQPVFIPGNNFAYATPVSTVLTAAVFK